MTNNNQKPKQQKPSYHIWLEAPDGNKRYAGSAYKHKKGNGLNILIGGVQYLAFEPKNNGDEGESA